MSSVFFTPSASISETDLLSAASFSCDVFLNDSSFLVSSWPYASYVSLVVPMSLPSIVAKRSSIVRSDSISHVW